MFDYSRFKIVLCSTTLSFFVVFFSHAQDLEKDLESRYLKICMGMDKSKDKCLKEFERHKALKLRDCLAVTPRRGRNKCKKGQGGLLRLKEYITKLEKEISGPGRWVNRGERIKAKVKVQKDLDAKYSMKTKSEKADKAVSNEGKRIKERWKKVFSKVKELRKSNKLNDLKKAEKDLKKAEKEKREFEKIKEDAEKTTEGIFYASGNDKPCENKKNSFKIWI